MTVDQQAFLSHRMNHSLGATTSRGTTSTSSRAPTSTPRGSTSTSLPSSGTSLPNSSPSSLTPSNRLPSSSPSLDQYNQIKQPKVVITTDRPTRTIQVTPASRNQQVQTFQTRKVEQLQQEYQIPSTPTPSPSPSPSPNNYPTLSPIAPQTAGFDAGEFLKDNWEVAAAVVGLLVLTTLVSGKKRDAAQKS